MDKNIKELLKIAKKRLSKGAYKEIKEMTDERELRDVLGRALVIHLEKECDKLNNQIIELESKLDYSFSPKIRLMMASNRIHFFKAGYVSKELSKIDLLLSKIRTELKDARNV